MGGPQSYVISLGLKEDEAFAETANVLKVQILIILTAMVHQIYMHLKHAFRKACKDR